jgi:hypothetical protein
LNGAFVTFEVDEMFEEPKQFTVIIVKDDSFKKYESQLEGLKTSVVSLKWVEACLIEEKFINPNNYDLFPKKKKKRKGKKIG